MTIGAQAVGEPPISAQTPIDDTTKKPPRRRTAIARPDANAQPEAR